MGCRILVGVVIACGAVIAASEVRPAEAAPRSGPSHCRPGEAIVYTCDFGLKTVSVCQSGETVLYRYGPQGRPEIELGRTRPPVTGALRNATASQQSLRFENGDHSYVVFDLDAGPDEFGPERGFSGVAIWRDGKPMNEMRCPQSGPRQQLQTSSLPASVRRDEDARYAVW